MPSIDYDDLEMALDFASAGPDISSSAYISRESGRVYIDSGGFGDEEELPEDIDDPARYVEMPSRQELDLGRVLVERFVSEVAPELDDAVRRIFRSKGAYGRYKDLLARSGFLEAWYEFERRETRAALCAWAAEEGFRVHDGDGATP